MAILALAVSGAWAQQGDGTDTGNQIHIFKPDKVAPTLERIAAIKAPAGFKVTPFATGLKNARIIAVAPNGNVYVSRRDQGDVVLLRDADGDGRADGPPEIVASRSGAHGLAIKDGKLYLVTVRELFVADILADGKLGPLLLLTGDLPDAGQHANRTLAFGPDGMLYMSIGSTCNDCNENNQENATIVRFNADFTARDIFASGLRNTIGFDWQPRTGELWGFDHGIDFLGDEDQPEELNKIEHGKMYGWPHVYADNKIYPQSTPVGEISKPDWKARSTPMVLGHTAHAAPMQLVFYKGAAFPAEYQGDAFATMRGSWNRKTASGYEIVRVHFEHGQARSIQPFVSGFLTDNGRTHIARPVGLAVARNGSLLMADDAHGVIYRVAYTGSAQHGAGELTTPAGPMQKAAQEGSGVPLALTRAQTQAQTQTQGKLTVSSSSFAAGGSIPAKYTEYADGVSVERGAERESVCDRRRRSGLETVCADRALGRVEYPGRGHATARGCAGAAAPDAAGWRAAGPHHARRDRLDRAASAGRRCAAPLPLPGACAGSDARCALGCPARSGARCDARARAGQGRAGGNVCAEAEADEVNIEWQLNIASFPRRRE
jgi:glucose/arabinose dehydrogenase